MSFCIFKKYESNFSSGYTGYKAEYATFRVVCGKSYYARRKSVRPVSYTHLDVYKRQTLNCGWGPKEILTENGKVKGIVFKKCLSVFDENKRFAPKFDEAVTMTVPCERVFLSIGQSIVWGNLLEGSKVELGSCLLYTSSWDRTLPRKGNGLKRPLLIGSC